MTTTDNAPAVSALDAATRMDAVTLRVGDLENMTSYYESALAVHPIEERSVGNEVYRVLGRGSVPFVRLIATPNLPAVDHRQAGLFHTAWLFDTKEALAATVYRAARDGRSRFVGSADHLVSEAFYFTDPEGNGIELYWDRPRSEWTWRDGEVAMDTLFLDPNAYLQEHLSERGVADVETQAGRVGHVHLQVGDLRRAQEFYVDALGFAPTLGSYRGALFTSAGGYHHHIAMNTWNSGGAGPPGGKPGAGERGHHRARSSRAGRHDRATAVQGARLC